MPAFVLALSSAPVEGWLMQRSLWAKREHSSQTWSSSEAQLWISPTGTPALQGMGWRAKSPKQRRPDLRNQWELAHPETVGFDDHDAAFGKVALDRREVCEQYVRLLFGSSLRAVAKQHD
jgi:hypothetical protein